jgi:hypothetical protein
MPTPTILLRHLSQSARSVLCQQTCMLVRHIRDFEPRFITTVNRKGDPTSEAWKRVLPIFVTGGASSSDFYRRVIRNAERQLIRKLGPTTKFRFFELDASGNSGPRPVSDEHGRLTVARGLTEDAEALARIIPHRDIHPMTWGRKERPDLPEV